MSNFLKIDKEQKEDIKNILQNSNIKNTIILNILKENIFNLLNESYTIKAINSLLECEANYKVHYQVLRDFIAKNKDKKEQKSDENDEQNKNKGEQNKNKDNQNEEPEAQNFKEGVAQQEQENESVSIDKLLDNNNDDSDSLNNLI